MKPKQIFEQILSVVRSSVCRQILIVGLGDEAEYVGFFEILEAELPSIHKTMKGTEDRFSFCSGMRLQKIECDLGQLCLRGFVVFHLSSV